MVCDREALDTQGSTWVNEEELCAALPGVDCEPIPAGVAISMGLDTMNGENGYICKHGGTVEESQLNRRIFVK